MWCNTMLLYCVICIVAVILFTVQPFYAIEKSQYIFRDGVGVRVGQWGGEEVLKINPAFECMVSL